MTTTASIPTQAAAALDSGAAGFGYPVEGVAGWAEGPGVVCAVTDGHLRTRPA